jgi:hypothetical protein
MRERGIQQAKFMLRLPVVTRRELADLARLTGLSSADLSRLAIVHLLRHPGMILRPIDGNQEGADERWSASD